MKVLELKNVWKIYRPSEAVEVQALRGVTLSIKKGEYVAITGPSGAGKSTLMHIMGCLDVPTKGKVLLTGKDITKMNEDDLARVRGRTIGFVFQRYNLISSLTALQNVELPLMFQGVDQEKRRTKAIELLKRLGLGNRLNHKPNQLSGGQQQRVAIARALITEPEIILADEPTGNLDSSSGEEVLNIFDELHQEGKTIIMVTHEDYVSKRAERIIRIRDGRIEK